MHGEDGMKHGVHIKEHKHWKTKTIYNSGHVMHIYRRQPKTIRFHSPMVNDFNQDLCGGWSMSDIKDEKEATIHQLITGNKPFASITYWQDQKVKAEDAQRRIASTGLATELRKRAFPAGQNDHVWDLLACQDMRVKDIGDLRALRDDYAEVFEMGLENKEIMPFADVPLSTFFDGWDSPPLPLWLTGIILGYPVENTVSIYLEGQE